MPRIADALSPRQYEGTPVSEMATAAPPTYAQQAARIPGRVMDALRALGAGQTYGTAEPTNSISDLARVRLGRGSVFGVPEDVQQRNVDRAMEAASIAAPINTTGLPNKGRELIRSKADELANLLNKQGFQATAEYSGSAAGPSAYVNVFDPQTGRFITSPARISGHSKGAYQSQFVHEISDDPQSTQRFVDLAMEMRAKGPTELMQKQGEAEKAAMQMRYESAQKKIAKGKLLTNSEKEVVAMIERQAGRTFAAPQDEALRLAQERAALPVERGGLGLPPNNTSEQRAAAMGFDTPAYHATDADISAFNNAKLGTNTAYLTGGDEDAIKSAMRGHWFSDRDLTNKDPRGYMFGDVSYPVKLANPKVINDKEFQSKSFIVKDPDNIRSRFAAFDPFRRNAAIAAAMGVAAPDLLAQERTKIKDLAKTK
jgi:hypothetical protein